MVRRRITERHRRSGRRGAGGGVAGHFGKRHREYGGEQPDGEIPGDGGHADGKYPDQDHDV